MYFDKDSRRRMERELGKRVVACISRWMNAYKVRGTDGCTVTVGYRTHSVRRV